MREGAKAKFMQSQSHVENKTSSEPSVIVGKESDDEEPEDYELPSESITPPQDL